MTKRRPSLEIYQEHNGFERIVVKETGASVTVNARELPSVYVTEDGLLECRYHPYKARQRLKQQPKHYVVKKIGPNNTYIMMSPSWALYSGPCWITLNGKIIKPNPDTGDIDYVNTVDTYNL